MQFQGSQGKGQGQRSYKESPEGSTFVPHTRLTLVTCLLLLTGLHINAG